MKNRIISCLLAFTFSINVNGQGGNIVLYAARAFVRQTPKVVLGIGIGLTDGIQEGIISTHKSAIASMDSRFQQNERQSMEIRHYRGQSTKGVKTHSPELKLYPAYRAIMERKNQELNADLNEKIKTLNEENQNTNPATRIFNYDRFVFGRQSTVDDLMPYHFE